MRVQIYTDGLGAYHWRLKDGARDIAHSSPPEGARRRATVIRSIVRMAAGCGAGPVGEAFRSALADEARAA